MTSYPPNDAVPNKQCRGALASCYGKTVWWFLKNCALEEFASWRFWATRRAMFVQQRRGPLHQTGGQPNGIGWGF